MEITKKQSIFIAIFVLMIIAVIVLSVFLGIYTYDRLKYKTSVENVYCHAYYALMENYMDIETNLEKVKVIRGNYMLEEVLTNVAENASLASLALSTLNTESNELTSIYKFTNQVGDYSKYLNKKIEKGELILDGERSTLIKMHDISRKIGTALASVKDNVNTDGYSFVDKLGKEDDAFSLAIRELNNGSVKYPALIYDGPFSDGIHDIKPKNLKGDKITKEQGIIKIKEMFDAVEDVKYTSTNTNKFTSFLYDVTLKDSGNASVQISEIGGHILMFTSFTRQGNDVVGEDEARKIGLSFLEEHGYKDMTDVYLSLSRGVYYINYAPKVDDVIYYPDIIKIKISSETGKVVGMEAMNYIYNHITRNVDKGAVKSETDILALVGSEIEIETLRLAIIPKGVDKEILTYEIIGRVGEDRYYIYLDAVSGEEVNVLMEIKSSGGNLLI